MSFIRILGHAVAKGAKDKINEIAQERVDRRVNTLCCAECHIELEANSNICHSCGSGNLCSAQDILENNKLQKEINNQQLTNAMESNLVMSAQDQEIIRFEKEQKKAFKARNKELHKGLVCTTCNVLHPKSHKFCPSCAVATRELTEDEINIHLEQEFPEFTQQ